MGHANPTNIYLFFRDQREHDYEDDILVGVFDMDRAEKHVQAYVDLVNEEGREHPRGGNSTVRKVEKLEKGGGVLLWVVHWDSDAVSGRKVKHRTHFRADPITVNKDITFKS